MNLDEALAEIEAWKDASGLENGGDPDGVTPEADKPVNSGSCNHGELGEECDQN